MQPEQAATQDIGYPIGERVASWWLWAVFEGALGLICVQASTYLLWLAYVYQDPTGSGTLIVLGVVGISILGIAAYCGQRAWQRRTYSITSQSVLVQHRSGGWSELVELGAITSVNVSRQEDVVPATYKIRIETLERSILIGPFERADEWAQKLRAQIDASRVAGADTESPGEASLRDQG